MYSLTIRKKTNCFMIKVMTIDYITAIGSLQVLDRLVIIDIQTFGQTGLGKQCRPRSDCSDRQV